ncbi:hypothetical protein ACLOJK_028661 [Asimina triloba]
MSDGAFNVAHWKCASASSGAPLSPKTTPMASLRHAPQRLSLSLDGVFLSQAICCRPPVTWEAPAPPLCSVTPPAVPLPAACSLRRCLLRHRPPLPLPLLFLRPIPVSLPSPRPATPLCPSSFPLPVPSIFVLSPSPLPLLSFRLLPPLAPCPAAFSGTGLHCLLRHRPPLPVRASSPVLFVLSPSPLPALRPSRLLPLRRSSRLVSPLVSTFPFPSLSEPTLPPDLRLPSWPAQPATSSPTPFHLRTTPGLSLSRRRRCLLLRLLLRLRLRQSIS